MTRSRTTKLAAVLAALTALALAAGCSSSDTSSNVSKSSGEKVTLTLWGTYGNGGNKAQTSVLSQQILPAFEKAHPNITVKYVDIPYDSLLQKLTTSAAGGELPDLVRSDIGWVAKFADLGVYAQLDGKMKDFDQLAAADYPGTVAANMWKGHYYGLPLDTNTRVLISNPDVLKKAGLSTPPASFDDVKALADKLSGKGAAAFADGGLQQWNILPWIWSGGGAITDDKVTKATGYLDSQQSVAAVQMLVDLYKEGQIPNLIIGNKGATSTSDGLPTGKYATILDGPWMQGIWSSQYPKAQPEYSQVPAGPGGSVSVVGGESINLTTSSKNPEAAYEFIRFTQSADYQLAMAKTGQMTVVKGLAAQAAEGQPFYQQFATQLQTAKARPAVPDAAKIDTILNTELSKAFQGKTSVQEALSAAASQIDPLLAG
jgi:multiple sugar transport system substrate-binding protein